MIVDETPGRQPSTTVAPGVLDRLIAPASLADFAETIWGRLPLLARGERSARGQAASAHPYVSDAADHGIDGLFSPEAVDELLTTRGLRAPFLRIAKQGRTLADSDFTSGGGVGAGIRDQVSDDRVRRQFASGATIVLQGLHRTWEPIVEFSQALAAELGHPVQVNAYVTPPGNQGFSAHYDVHDVFVLQVHGAKAWRVHAPVWPDPLRSQPWDERRDAVAAAAENAPLIDAEVAAGDVLYLPRGYIHSAAAPADAEQVSIHLTVGIHTWTRAHLVDAALEQIRALLAHEPSLRGSLPLGLDVSDPRMLDTDIEVVRQAIVRSAGQVSETALAASLLAGARASQRAAPLSVLAQVADARALTLSDRLHLRAHLLAHLEHDSTTSQVTVRSRAGRATVSAQCIPALQRLLAGEQISVHELHPDRNAALEAGRLLLVEGVARLANGGE